MRLRLRMWRNLLPCLLVNFSVFLYIDYIVSSHLKRLHGTLGPHWGWCLSPGGLALCLWLVIRLSHPWWPHLRSLLGPSLGPLWMSLDCWIGHRLWSLTHLLSKRLRDRMPLLGNGLMLWLLSGCPLMGWRLSLGVSMGVHLVLRHCLWGLPWHW